MPKFNVVVIATDEVEVEADTQEEAEALAISIVEVFSPKWSIEYCDELDEDDDEDEA